MRLGAISTQNFLAGLSEWKEKLALLLDGVLPSSIVVIRVNGILLDRGRRSQQRRGLLNEETTVDYEVDSPATEQTNIVDTLNSEQFRDDFAASLSEHPSFSSLTSIANEVDPGDESDSLQAGEVVGIVIGAVLFLAVAVLAGLKGSRYVVVLWKVVLLSLPPVGKTEKNGHSLRSHDLSGISSPGPQSGHPGAQVAYIPFRQHDSGSSSTGAKHGLLKTLFRPLETIEKIKETKLPSGVDAYLRSH
jgi:hypothetical protein